MSDTVVVYVETPTVLEVGTTGPQGPAGTGLDTLTTKGDLLTHNGTTAVRLGVGTDGHVLTAQADGSVAWEASGSGSGTFATDIEASTTGTGLIMKSPNGSRWRLTPSNTGLPVFTALVLFLLAQLAPAQTVGIGRSGTTVVTDTNAALTWSNAFAFTNGADATTRTNLFSTGGVPSLAAVAGAAYVADGAGGSSFEAQRIWLVRQTTNGPTVTNGTTTSSLVISNLPAGLYWINGQMNSTATAGRTWTFLAPNQVFGPRNLLGWFDNGSAAGFFNAATNLSANADGGTGARNISISGPLLFTNTATVSFNISVTGATNTAQVLSNSFLFIRKLD
jgi:hypothetical protein